MHFRTSIFSIPCAVCLFFLSACTVGPDFVRPEPPAVKQYTHSTKPGSTVPADGQAQHFEDGAVIAADWWRLFNSPKLDAVVKDAVANNPGLQAAEASLRRSQEILRAGYGIFYPQIGAGADMTRQKQSVARLGGGQAGSGIFNLFTLSASVSYALDLFGGERRTVERLEAERDFQDYLVKGAYLTLTGNVANTIIAQAGYRAQIEAVSQIVALQKEQVRITEIQAQAGTVPYSNVFALKSQLASVEATLPPLRQKLSQTDHLLAVLSGRAPAESGKPEISLTDISLPLNLPVSLPSDLVRQRPDILAAEAQLHGASADIGIATAALFPSFSLNGTYGQDTIRDHLRETGNFWGLGANLSAPLFSGGSLWRQRQAAIEGHQQSLALYRQTVLNAFAQVADTLRALEHDAEALNSQYQALDAADKALRLIKANYEAGTAGYIQVLTANSQYYQARTGYLQAQAQRLQDTVALFVALGGGWWNAGK